MKLLETLKAEGRIEEARQHGLLQLIEHPQHAELHYEVASLHDMQGREAQAIPSTRRPSGWDSVRPPCAAPGWVLAAPIAAPGNMPRPLPPSTRAGSLSGRHRVQGVSCHGLP